MDQPNFRADMHCHSTFSDGTMTPQELIDEAKAKGLQGLSITDHDSIMAYDTDVQAYAQSEGIELVTGIELSCRLEQEPIHILGYAFDPQSADLRQLCERHIQRREERNLGIVERLKGRGIVVDYEAICQNNSGVIGRPHIATELIEQGLVKNMQEAFDKYLGDKRPCCPPGVSFSVEEAVEIIHLAGGKAFLAHPHLIRRKELVKRVLACPMDGLEAYYARFPLDKEQPWIDLAVKRGLLISGGSDFHGSIKPQNPLGSSWIGESAFRAIHR